MSKNTFELVHENQFDELLKADKNWSKEITPSTREIVYIRPFRSNPNLVIKVYSSVKQGDSLGRGCGQDAIRVCAVNIKTQKGVRKSRRVNRVPGWQGRVQERVMEMWNELK